MGRDQPRTIPSDPIAPRDLGALFRHVFETEYEYVWRSLRRLGVPTQDVEDLAHEVFVRVHRALERYDRERPLRPWLFAFAFHVASEHRRIRSNVYERPHGEIEHVQGGQDPTPARDARELVLRALDALSETTRPVFVMYEIDGFSMKEIADSLEVPLHTAYSRLRLAREAFVACVRQLEQEGS